MWIDRTEFLLLLSLNIWNQSLCLVKNLEFLHFRMFKWVLFHFKTEKILATVSKYLIIYCVKEISTIFCVISVFRFITFLAEFVQFSNTAQCVYAMDLNRTFAAVRNISLILYTKWSLYVFQFTCNIWIYSYTSYVYHMKAMNWRLSCAKMFYSLPFICQKYYGHFWCAPAHSVKPFKHNSDGRIIEKTALVLKPTATKKKKTPTKSN